MVEKRSAYDFNKTTTKGVEQALILMLAGVGEKILEYVITLSAFWQAVLFVIIAIAIRMAQNYIKHK